MKAGTWNTNCPGIKTPKEFVGFVYIITEKKTNKMYIGCKKFWTKKGKPTNWKTYVSSSGSLKGFDINNPKLFKKDIIYVAESITKMKAYEAYMQLQFYWNGKWDQLYNEMVNLRVRIRKAKKE